MKKIATLALILVVALILVTPVAMAKGPGCGGCGGCDKGGGQGHGKQAGQGKEAGHGKHQGYGMVMERLETLPVESLTAEEIEALVYLREEEKLARDVYAAFAEKWDAKVFSNIAGAEQRHMDLVGALLARHEIEDPVVDDTAGVFTNPELRDLHTALTESGEASLEQALLAGAAIEDKDIFDLNALIELSKNADVKLVAYNLVKGSRNHLRAYSKNISKKGYGAYEAQHLEQSVFDGIAASERERGVVYDETGGELATYGSHGKSKGNCKGEGKGKGQGQGQGKGQGQGHGGHGQKGGCKNPSGV